MLVFDPLCPVTVIKNGFVGPTISFNVISIPREPVLVKAIVVVDSTPAVRVVVVRVVVVIRIPIVVFIAVIVVARGVSPLALTIQTGVLVEAGSFLETLIVILRCVEVRASMHAGRDTDPLPAADDAELVAAVAVHVIAGLSPLKPGLALRALLEIPLLALLDLGFDELLDLLIMLVPIADMLLIRNNHALAPTTGHLTAIWARTASSSPRMSGSRYRDSP
jgi:hypothetical protein